MKSTREIILLLLLFIVSAFAYDGLSTYTYENRFYFRGGKMDFCKMPCDKNYDDFACSNGKMGRWNNGTYGFYINNVPKGYVLSNTTASIFGSFGCEENHSSDVVLYLNDDVVDINYSNTNNQCKCNQCDGKLPLYSHRFPGGLTAHADGKMNYIRVEVLSNTVCLSFIDLRLEFVPRKTNIRTKRLVLKGDKREIPSFCQELIAGSEPNRYFLGSVPFSDPLPPGAILMGVSVKVYYSSPYDFEFTIKGYINEHSIGYYVPEGEGIRCRGVKSLLYESDFHAGGLPGYKYSGENTFELRSADNLDRLYVGEVEIIFSYLM